MFDFLLSPPRITSFLFCLTPLLFCPNVDISRHLITSQAQALPTMRLWINDCPSWVWISYAMCFVLKFSFYNTTPTSAVASDYKMCCELCLVSWRISPITATLSESVSTCSQRTSHLLAQFYILHFPQPYPRN